MSHSELDIGESGFALSVGARGDAADAVAFSTDTRITMGGMTATCATFIRRALVCGELSFARGECAAGERGQIQVRRVEAARGRELEFDGVEFEVLRSAVGWELKPRGQDDASMVLR